MNRGRPGEQDQQPIITPRLRDEALPRQVTTLAFLFQDCCSLISQQLAASLMRETQADVILVRLRVEEACERTANGISDSSWNGEFRFAGQMAKTEAGVHLLNLRAEKEPPTPAGIHALLSELSRHFRYVLVETQVNEPPFPWLFELLSRSHLAYVFHELIPQQVEQLGRLMAEARPRCRYAQLRVKPIGCLREGDGANDSDQLAHSLGCPAHLFVRDCPQAANPINEKKTTTDLFQTDVRRLAREIGGRLLGLALSSGAAKGLAHGGVIQVLEENGIEVDVVAGASMGAYVGALWTSGLDGAELERLARELETRWALWSLIDPAFPPRQGFLRGFAVKRRLMRSIGRARFGDLTRPLRVVASNLATLERVVFSSGEVATAVHASIAVPGICVPITLEGTTYVDGGIVDPLPVDVLREMGVARVIAVNVIPTPERIRHGLEAERQAQHIEETARLRFFRKTLPLDQQLNYFARGNLLEILTRSLHGAQIRLAEASCALADVVLRPEICDDRWLDYRHPAKFIALGREVAERHLEEIQSLVARKEGAHDRNRVSEALGAMA